MPNWIQNGSIYYVQPTEPEMTLEEHRAYMAQIYAKLEAAKREIEQREKGMSA